MSAIAIGKLPHDLPDVRIDRFWHFLYGFASVCPRRAELVEMIVVTGASGFIGSNVVAELNRRGCGPVVAVDDYPNLRGRGDTSKINFVPRYGNQSARGQIVDFHDLSAWLDSRGDAVQAVVHLGACSDTTVTDRDFVMSVNLEYTKALWHWCCQRQRPLVYASSAATYGDGALGYDDARDPSCYRPLNLYGESKHLFDLWALQQAATPPRWAGVKYFNVYGPNEVHKGRMASVVYHSYGQIRETGQVRLFKSHREGIPDGGQQRDFVYVGDAVAATLHLLDTPVSELAPNGLYNVGTGTARTFADLATAVFLALGRTPAIQYVPMPDDLQSRYQYFTQANIQKLRAAGFTQRFHSIEDGVRQYVRQHLQREMLVA